MAHGGFGDYGSEFEVDSEVEHKKRARRDDLARPAKRQKVQKASSQQVIQDYDKEEARVRRHHYLSLDAYSRHRVMVNNYLLYYGGSLKDFGRDKSQDKRDIDIVKEHHRFLWEDDDEEDTWEARLAKKYYDKLFKEYCICDLTRYKENKVAMRWRIEKEVIAGKGQFTCGNKACKAKTGMKSWEVNFGYIEQEAKKNALVKLRLCPDCSRKLNYRHRRKEWKKPRKEKEKQKEEKEKEKEKETDSATGTAEEGPSSLSPCREGPSSLEAGSSSSPSRRDADDTDEPKNVWSAPVKVTEDKSREEEFDDYLEDMFL